MLTVTLRTLEADGLVSRTVYAEVPPQRRIPTYGNPEKSLIPHIESLVGWALEHMTGIFDSREKGPRTTMRIVKIFTQKYLRYIFHLYLCDIN